MHTPTFTDIIKRSLLRELVEGDAEDISPPADTPLARAIARGLLLDLIESTESTEVTQ